MEEMNKKKTLTQINQMRYNAERKALDEYAKRELNREGLVEAINRHYLQEVESKINTFYMTYAESEGIALAEAKRRADQMDVVAFGKKAKQAVLDKDFSNRTNEWLKVYNLKMKVSREELLRYEIQHDLYNLTKESESVMLSGMADEYRIEIERQAGILGNSVPDVSERINNLIDADFYGTSFSEKVWGRNGRYDSTNKEVMKTLGRIVGQDSDYQKEVSRLRKIFDTNESETYRLVRTETRRMNANAQLDTYKDNEFTHYIFVAEPGACLTCASLDQTAVPVDEAHEGDNYPSMHPNCRCSTYGVIKLTHRDTGKSNIDAQDEKYGDYEDAKKDLADLAKGKIKSHDELRNKSKDYLDLSYFGFGKDRAK